MPPADIQQPLPLAGKETRAFTPGRGAVLVGGLAGPETQKARRSELCMGVFSPAVPIVAHSVSQCKSHHPRIRQPPDQHAPGRLDQRPPCLARWQSRA